MKGVQIEGYEVTFMKTNERDGYGKFKATLKENRYSSAFMRAYLIKKQQFNNIILLKSKVAHGSVVITMDTLKSISKSLRDCRGMSISNIE